MKAANRVLLTMRMIAKSMVTPFRPYASREVQTADQRELTIEVKTCNWGNAKPVLSFRTITFFERPVQPSKQRHSVCQI